MCAGIEDKIASLLSKHPRPRGIWLYWWTPEKAVDRVMDMMLSECRHIMRAVVSSRSRIIRSVPACFRHPTARQKSISEFICAMKTRVVPALKCIHNNPHEWDGLENPPDSPFMEALWGVFGEMIRGEALRDMYIIARIHELGIMPQSVHWYDAGIKSMRGLTGWEVVCSDATNTLYHHPMLPHPDHMIWVRNDRDNVRSSWASVVASPPLITDCADEDILVMTRLVGCPDIGKPHPVERVAGRRDAKDTMNKMLSYDDVFEKSIDIADNLRL